MRLAPYAIVVVTLVCAASAALAAPSGLNIITTADMVGPGEIALEYANDGPRLFGGDCNHWALLEVGLGNRAEVGVDRCFDGETGTFGNVKVLLQPEDETRPAVALGVQNLARGELAEPYLALSKDVDRARLHLGAIRLEGDIEAMAGVEWSLGGPTALVLDHVSGADSATGVGLDVEVSDRFGVLFSRIFSHAEEGDDAWQLILTLSTAIGS
jgi:hypothetical protein